MCISKGDNVSYELYGCRFISLVVDHDYIAHSEKIGTYIGRLTFKRQLHVDVRYVFDSPQWLKSVGNYRHLVNESITTKVGPIELIIVETQDGT